MSSPSIHSDARSPEREPLLNATSSVAAPATRAKVDLAATLLVISGLVLFVGSTLWMVWGEQKDPVGNIWFSLHPTMQSIAIAGVVYAIWGLQPTTSTAPKEKTEAFKMHRSIVLALVLPAIIVGSSAMFYNKLSHGAKHFTTWHGIFGLTTVLWLFVQSLSGLVVSYKPLYNLIGGQALAKELFKHHRASGYALLPLLLVTAHLAGGHSTWALGTIDRAFRIAGSWVGLPMIFVGMVLRIRPSKMAFFM